MEIIGVIAEYSPFHNGHLYQLNYIKKLYKDSLIIVVLNGVFLQRGIPSIETIYDKTTLALKYGVDLVVSLPVIFGSNSADYFADASISILNHLKVDKIIFGSELNNIDLLTKLAKKQLNDKFNENVKKYLKMGYNYPTSLSKSLKTNINMPNDLLGISYIKSIIKNNYNITPISIKRTNNYHDLKDNSNIISASNIRNKIANKEDINNYIPEGNIVNINYDLLYTLLKYKINTCKDLTIYLGVDEGIDKLFIKHINKCNNLNSFIESVKTKRYTYNKISRTIFHILISLTKEEKNSINNVEYLHILGFNLNGKKYLNKIKKDISIPTSIIKESKTWEIEKRALILYELISNTNVYNFSNSNKPIIM